MSFVVAENSICEQKRPHRARPDLPRVADGTASASLHRHTDTSRTSAGSGQAAGDVRIGHVPIR